MPKSRGRVHTTLTETAQTVVRVLERIEGIKMIAPGIIDARRSGERFITAVETAAGAELIISGQGVQKVAVHLADCDFRALVDILQTHKKLQHFSINVRQRFPGE